MRCSAIPFPPGTASAREERAFDLIFSIAPHARVPLRRLRIRTSPGGIDMRWLLSVTVIVHERGRDPVAGKFTQWRDGDSCDFIATLGEEHSVSNAAFCGHVPPEGRVALVSGGRSRSYPFFAP